ncbi:hypothetical protein KCP74_08360 [Salmonella enterica subsp. enterica]|nr:hypothetical protein KCP74_08360 [Salmonella enterica subsp. enterica]
MKTLTENSPVRPLPRTGYSGYRHFPRGCSTPESPRTRDARLAPMSSLLPRMSRA